MTSEATSKLEHLGRSWNRFWFTPTSALPCCVLRIFVGVLLLLYAASHTFDLLLWFGPNGLLPNETVRQVAGLESFLPSPLQWTESAFVMRALHLSACFVFFAMTLGCFGRISSIAALLMMLMYVHRAPMITEQVEPVLTMLVAYLCLAPSTRFLSIDAWMKRRTKNTQNSPTEDASVTANVSLRLIQLHLVGFYLMMACSKLGAGSVWWSGDAVWVLIAQPDSRLLDLSFLRDYLFVINAWTHAIVLFEFLFAILIWQPFARPVLLGLSLLAWTSLAIISGLALFSLAVLCAGVAFIPPERLERLFRKEPQSKS